MPEVEEYRKLFEERSAWGLTTSVDLFDCDPAKIRSEEAVRQFAADLCKLIKVTPFGDTQVVHFGKDPKVVGYSFVQLIETSLISGHLSDESNAAYIDIFSCRFYDFEKASSFTKDFFGAKHIKTQVYLR